MTTANALAAQQAIKSGQTPQWPGQQTSGSQVPPMDQVSARKPLLKSLGATGTAVMAGIITSEEYNQDFYWKDAIQVYEMMCRNDAQIFATRMLMELPIRRATWSIEPASDSARDKEIASFVETCLMHDMRYKTTSGRVLTQKWDDILRHILMMLPFGFMPFEVNWRIEDGWVKWARWTPLLPRTIWRWWVGEDNELAGIQQWTYKNYSYVFVDIPADKLLLFVNRQEGNNFEGVSVLRSAYKHWWYKDSFYKIDAVGIERNAVSIPVIGLPENFTSDDITKANSILANMRANESMGVTLPPGWTIEYMRNWEKYDATIQPAIDHHDVMIARNILGQFINLGSTETGAFALDASQKATFLSALQAVCEYIQDVINDDAIPRLVDYNFADVAVYPKLKASKVLAQDFDQIAKALNQLASHVPTPYIHADPELEDFLRNELGLPKAPKSVIEAYNPTSPATPDQPDAKQNGNTPGEDAESIDTGASGKGKADQQADDEDNATPDGSDGAGGDGSDGGGGGGGGDLHELSAELRLLREVWGAMDAVGRGERSPERSGERAATAIAGDAE